MIAYPNVKVNLGLNVLRKREDGYHDLETLFLPYYGLHDVLEIIQGDDYSRTSAALFSRYGAGSGASCEERTLVQDISSDGKVMITIARKEGVDWSPASDLCVKAYNILDADFSLPPVKIFLEKLSPVGAGLGGGSADAAFALKMLDEMFSLGMGRDRMAEYASRLGSDCAFFIYDRPMFGEGRGEVLSEYYCKGGVESVSEDDVLVAGGKRYAVKVVVPEGISVSTADAYRGITPCVPEQSLREVLSKPVCEWKSQLFNDFEKTVFKKYPELGAIKESLYESGAEYASMSGSGSALFALYPED